MSDATATVQAARQAAEFSAAVFTALGAAAALLVTLLINRRKAIKLKAETVHIEKDTAGEEADRIIRYLREQREELEALRKADAEDHKRELNEQRAFYEGALDKLRERLEERILGLERRLNIFGCRRAPLCKTHEALEGDEDIKAGGTD